MIKINNFELSKNSPTFLIAEGCENHLGSLDLAFEMIDKAIKYYEQIEDRSGYKWGFQALSGYYFDIGENDGDLLYKKRSHKRRKIKRKPRRGRDNR